MQTAGYLFRFLLAPVVLITGLVEGFALAPESFRKDPFILVRILPRIGILAWVYMEQHFPVLWEVLRAVSPYPRLTQPVPLLSWAGWFLSSIGLVWLGFGLLKRSGELRQNADDAEKTLKLQAPFLLQMQAFQSLQGNRVSDISGNGNVVNAINTVNNALQNGDKERWWREPGGLILIGVIINLISKFIGAS